MIRSILPLCLSLLPAAALAQDQSGAVRHLTLLGIPSATVAPHGSLFASLSLANNRANTTIDDEDGSLALGFGFGDANDTIGVQVTAEITSLTDDFGDAGFFDIKGSRRILEGRTPLYLGLQVSDLAGWGDSEDNETSTDLILTGFHLLENGMPLMFSVGFGNKVVDDYTEPGGYAGLGVGFSSNFAASASWYGDYGIVGVSFTPTNHRNMSFNASLQDVTDNTGDRTGIFSFNYILPKAFGG